MADKIIERSEIENLPMDKDLAEMHSVSLKDDAPEIDPVLEKKLLWKTDLNLIPITFMLFLCAFIDR